mgnify:CR=1 FL=1
MAGKKKKKQCCGEDALIERMKTLLGDPVRDVPLGIGDDCAVIGIGGGDTDLLVTTDLLVEGTHFRLEWSSPYQVGWKAVAANVSDIASMGGRPTFAVVSIGLRARSRDYTVESLYEGISAAARRYGVTVVGGDTVLAERLTVNVALLGEVRRGRALMRKGARPGDLLFVTGTCGDGAAGLDVLGTVPREDIGPTFMRRLVEAHLKPDPCIEAGVAAASTGAVTAMMDLSDGLAADLPRLALRSGIGARVSSGAVPVSFEMIKWCKRAGRDPLELALGGGEDFNLLMAVKPERADSFAAMVEHAGVPVTEIGRAVPREEGLCLVDENGQARDWPAPGFEHF